MRRLDAELSQPLYSEVTAKKRDIVAYRRERINEVEFRKRVVCLDHRPDASTTKKIGVMAAILDKQLMVTNHPVPDYNRTIGHLSGRFGGALFCKRAKRISCGISSRHLQGTQIDVRSS